MSTSRRSTTGCSLCKARRKKCDETKPECLRCQASGRSCKYEYFEYPDSERHRVKRTKPASRTSELFVKASRSIDINPVNSNLTCLIRPLISGDSNLLPASTSFAPWNDTTYPDSSLDLPRDASGFLSMPFTPTSSLSFHDIKSTEASSDPDPLPTPTDTTSPTLSSTSQLIALEGDLEDDPEGVRATLCRTPMVDKSLKENSLPFVLYCYSQWAITSMFEPQKIMNTMRDQVIAQFSLERTRSRSILIANAMNLFIRGSEASGARGSILNHLALDAKKNGTDFIAAPPLIVPVLDRQNAIRTLDNMLEILGLQLETHTTSECLKSLQYAAPVFRRACPDDLGKPINLPNLLLDLSLNPRFFATIDLTMSLITGLPTLFQYEVPFSLELCERIYRWQLRGNYGTQWLYGFPDQFLILFAWINTLSATPGANDNPELVARIERQLPQIKVATDESGDPVLQIRRIVVVESWRLAAFIYLYMVLGKANAHDPRVIRAQQDFMRLVRELKPGRNPDLHIFAAMVVTGVATTEEHDRDTLRYRIFNFRGSRDPGSIGNHVMMRLEDVWSRTRDEGRAAVWSDLGVAYHRVVNGRVGKVHIHVP